MTFVSKMQVFDQSLFRHPRRTLIVDRGTRPNSDSTMERSFVGRRDGTVHH